MAIKTIIRDSDGNELDCFINTNGNAVITVARPDLPEDFSLVTLDKEDIDHLIEKLRQLKEELN